MSSPSAPAALLVIGVLALVVAAVCAGVKFRAASRRGFGVQVYDLGADLTLPRQIHARTYQIALYLTMKSRPSDPAAPPPPDVSATAAGR